TLVDDEMLKEINDVIVRVGHEVFKKKEKAALRLKTDSFVVETDTHFPTDYNLLWDSARKCIDIAVFLRKKAGLKGWRKASDWRRNLKGQMRRVGRASSGGGKNKARRLEGTVGAYLCKAGRLAEKVNEVLDNFVPRTELHLLKMIEMEHYL